MGKSELYAQMSSNETQISALQEENYDYQTRITQLKAVYEEMKQAKADLKAHKSHVEDFSNENLALWKGDLFKSRYQSFLQGTIASGDYNTVISEIDKNMAVVNNQRCEYENEMYRNEGLIGNLRSLINSIWTQIQNWID